MTAPMEAWKLLDGTKKTYMYRKSQGWTTKEPKFDYRPGQEIFLFLHSV
jgi:hypothetical protein